MSFIYRLLIYLFVVWSWALWVYPLSEIEPSLSFLIYAVGSLYVAGNGKEREQ